MASCVCVLPILIMFENSWTFAYNYDFNYWRAGKSTLYNFVTVAMWITVGKLSLLDWLIFTWSFGWTDLSPICPPNIYIALFAITSFAFIFDWVPDPVCHITSGKWSSN